MTSQGADERRIRGLLVRMGVGPDATPTTTLEAPADSSDAWWDDLYADEQPEERRPSPRLPNWWQDKPEQLPGPLPDPAPDTAVPDTGTPPTSTAPAGPPPPDASGTPPAAQATARRHTPPQSLLDAWDGISPRTRWLVYHATAAAAGWPIGLVGWGSNTAAWFAAGHWTAPSAWVLYGLGLCAISLYRRARTWAWPAAWAAAIPVSSTTLGVLLYAPTT